MQQVSDSHIAVISHNGHNGQQVVLHIAYRQEKGWPALGEGINQSLGGGNRGQAHVHQVHGATELAVKPL